MARWNMAVVAAISQFDMIEGKSIPRATVEDEPMRLDATAYQGGVPELVAAELRDCHQRLVEGRCSEADRTYQSLASPPSELPAAVIAPV